MRRVWLIMLLPAILIPGWVWLAWNWTASPSEEYVTIEPGTPVRTIAADLARHGIVLDRWSFLILVSTQGQVGHLQAGEYRFTEGVTAREVLDRLTSGRTASHRLTVIEGWTFREMLQNIRKAPRLKRSIAHRPDRDIMAALGHADLDPEGRFFPDSYTYDSRTDDQTLLERAFQRMRDQLEAIWAERAPGLALRDPYQALILASIIEKESGADRERPVISAVFHNRLRKGMPLQADPTVIYGMGRTFSGDLTKSDLSRKTPWNTYRHRGLPPTPICLPSADSLRAAVRPASSRAIFFVARGDGSHEFSVTLREHNAAVLRYQVLRSPPLLAPPAEGAIVDPGVELGNDAPAPVTEAPLP